MQPKKAEQYISIVNIKSLFTIIEQNLNRFEQRLIWGSSYNIYHYLS